MRCQAAPRSHWVFKQASGFFFSPQNVNQKILTLHGVCFIIIIFSQQLYHQGLTEGGKNQAVLKEKGKKKTITLRHLFQYFSPSFGRITRRPPPWLSVSVREIAFFPDSPAIHQPADPPPNPLPTPAALLLPFWPSAWPISVRPLSCAILSVLASCYSRVALLPVSRPLLLSLTSPLDSFCMLSKPPPRASSGARPAHSPSPSPSPRELSTLLLLFLLLLFFFGYFWGSTFSFHLAARPPFLLQGHIM